LIQKNRFWLVLLLALGIIFSLSVVYYHSLIREPPVDYKGLAEQWIPEIEESDLIFVQRHWVTTPIFYYLRADRFNLVGYDYAEQIHQNPDSRVWVLSFPYVPMTPEMVEALKGFQASKELQALRIQAVLYSRVNPQYK
jgi:hypothetical protein